jgi:hypothetical protein
MKTKIILLIIVLSLFTDIVIAQENNYTAMLKVGKVWNYDLAYMEIPEGGGDAISKHTDYKIWIDGDSILDGKSFFKMRFSKSGVIINIVSLLCEQDGTVYMYNPRSQELQKMYDFSVSSGESLHHDGAYIFTDCHVLKTDSILAHGIMRRRISLEIPEFPGIRPLWVEGIGNPNRLDEPLMHMVSDGCEYTLLSCYEGDDCVFEAEDFQVAAITAGITESHYPFLSDYTNSSQPSSGAVYDLKGRHLTSPPTHGIYIQNGKKKIIK